MTYLKPVDRRTFLRGAGAAVALPLLDAMLPYRARAAGAQPALPARMAVFYFGTGMNMRQFEPATEGPDFQFPRILKPLEPYRDRLTVFSGTYLEHGGGHQGDYTFLTGAKTHTSAGIQNTISADQVAAEHLGQETRFPSLQFSVSRGTGFGGPLKTVSWNRNGVPLSAESDPHVIFNRLFGDDSPEYLAARQREIRRRSSILDAVGEDAKRLHNLVGVEDRRRLDEYLGNVRELEQQLQRNADWLSRPRPNIDTAGRGDFTRSYDPDETRDFHYETYSRLMYDLVCFALQTDSTRVLTYVVRRELVDGVFPEFGVSKGYHELSHHNNDPKNLEELAQVDVIYMRCWSYLLERMASIREVDGVSLLDRSMLAFSSGMGIGHSKDRLPTLLCGGKELGVAHRGHLRLPEKTPLSRLWHTMLDRMRAPVGDKFQDSTGPITDILRTS